MNSDNNIFNGANSNSNGGNVNNNPPYPPQNNPTGPNVFNGQPHDQNNFDSSYENFSPQPFQPQSPQSPQPFQPSPISQQTSSQPFFGFSSPEEDNRKNIPSQSFSSYSGQGLGQSQNPSQNLNQGPNQNSQFPNQTGIITPTQPITSNSNNNNRKSPRQPANPQQTIKKFTILSIVLGIAAVIFLFLGIWGLVDATSTRTKLADSNTLLSDYSLIIHELEQQTGVVIDTVNDLPVYQAANDYVYITDWNIKLKIPDTLTSISYLLNQNANYHSYICFNAVQTGVQYFPAFADINQNRDGIGCLYRIATTDGEKDSNGNSYGQKVFTSGEYNYFYKEPAKLFSGSEAEKGLETTARDLVKQMIVDNISTY